MEPGGFFTGMWRHAECPPGTRVFLGHVGEYGPLDVCTCCWMIDKRAGPAPQAATPPACAGCGLTHAYGFTRLVEGRWVWDCPRCSAANASAWRRDRYVGTWTPDDGWPDAPLTAGGIGPGVVALDADDAAAAALAGELTLAGTAGDAALVEVVLAAPTGLELHLVWRPSGRGVAAWCGGPGGAPAIVPTEGPWRARLAAAVERALARLHADLVEDLPRARDAARVGQAWVRLRPVSP